VQTSKVSTRAPSRTRDLLPALQSPPVRAVAIALPLLGLLVFPRAASALDKQGSAHGGSIEGPPSGFGLAGNAAFGAALYNPAYAARPNNSGLTLFRAAAHVDVDLIGSRLSIPLDVNMFTDRTARGSARWLAPSELDLIGGVTSTWRLGPGALEGGARIESDRALDRGGYPEGREPPSSQMYVDARARYLMSLAAIAPDAAAELADGDLSGWLTLGWFAVNEGFFARPDNTGRALLRYAAHAELAVWEKQIALVVDTTFFTDRRTSALRPSELDLTAGVVLRGLGGELHLAYERDMPIDRGGLVQHFVYTLVSVPFTIVAHDEPPQ